MRILKLLSFQDPDAALIIVMSHVIVRYPDGLKRIEAALEKVIETAHEMAREGIKEEDRELIH
jgi:hypothetical protein